MVSSSGLLTDLESQPRSSLRAPIGVNSNHPAVISHFFEVASLPSCGYRRGYVLCVSQPRFEDTSEGPIPYEQVAGGLPSLEICLSDIYDSTYVPLESSFV